MAGDTAVALTIDDVFIVDADVHAHETAAGLVPYVEADWRSALEHVAHVPERYLDMPAFCPAPEKRAVLGGLPAARGGREEIVWDAAQMRRELDAFSIDTAILFPDNFLKLAAIPHRDYAMALVRAYNRWIVEEWLSDAHDLYAALLVAPQDPEASAIEIARYAAHPRFVGVYLPTCQAYPLWGHRQYDPIFAAAQAHGMPVMLHSVSGAAAGFPFNLEQFTTSITAHTVSHVFAMMANMMSMLETGVPVRFPDVRIVFLESGLTWVPFIRMRLDKEYNENRREWSHFDDRPSHYIARMYFATQPVEEPTNLRDLVDIIRIYDGEETTLFASDWPHHDFDHPRAVFQLPMSDDARRKVMGLNAVRLMPKIRVPARYDGRAHRRLG